MPGWEPPRTNVNSEGQRTRNTEGDSSRRKVTSDYTSR